MPALAARARPHEVDHPTRARVRAPDGSRSSTVHARATHGTRAQLRRNVWTATTPLRARHGQSRKLLLPTVVAASQNDAARRAATRVEASRSRRATQREPMRPAVAWPCSPSPAFSLKRENLSIASNGVAAASLLAEQASQ